jgi:type IV pilus assembly protein PilY1
MKRLILIIAAIFSFMLFLPGGPEAAVMEDYCQIPPYVIQNVAPNVMLVVDNSGSMFYFAYFDGFNTTTSSDDNLCSSSGNPCDGFTDPGTYPNYKYYGYFNPDYWYEYSSNRFYPSGPKLGSGLGGERTKNASEWDGNFLNWLTMRRIDVIRKVLTGGKTSSGEGSGYDRLVSEIADCDSRGVYKTVNNPSDYTPYSSAARFDVDSANSSCGGGGTGTPEFDVRNSGGSLIDSFKVQVKVPSPVEGALQRVVGTRARIGLSYYNRNATTPHGGHVRVYVSGGSLSSTVNEVNLSRPDSNTPLGETLWSMAGYFSQESSLESGPGPRYNSGDYQLNNNVDPLNYGTGGSPRWPQCSKSFILFITDGEPCQDGNLPSSIEDYANGKSAYDCDGSNCPAVGPFPAATLPACSGGYVAGIEDVALWMHTNDLRSSTIGANEIPEEQNLTMYAVFAFGKGSTLLRYAAINGGFEDSNNNDIPDLQSEWDADNNNEPDTFYEATEGYELEKAIENALSTILKRASSGTAASVLASGEGSGASLIQAVFYPRRRFGNDIIYWTGSLQNLWFYVDPFFSNSNIREDTVKDNILNLEQDYISQLYFDNDTQTTRARRFEDTDGDGDADVSRPTVTLETLGNIWEAGELLWDRTEQRTLYTADIVNGTTDLIAFTNSSAADYAAYLDATDVNGDSSNVDEAANIINFIHGEDPVVDGDSDGVNDFRSREVTISSYTKVWKLGDIVNSTPKISTWIPLNSYYDSYLDYTYKGYTDTTGPTGYKERGMVFAGGNDGMLHAFKLGKLELGWSGQGYLEKARLTGSNLGKEMWAFIPTDALPYLKYIGDPQYCHLYTVDLSPYIFDASVARDDTGSQPPECTDTEYWDCDKTVDSWRTILIGGMRYGGACRETTAACTDCVKTPVDVGGTSLGYSSYFALDITDQNNPKLLWEFTNPDLGFATTGPSVVKINSTINPGGGNGRWFVVLGSGPTGPIDTVENQFLGRSDQNLKLFVLDVKTGTLLRTIDTGVEYAFAGSMINSTNDSDLDYQDDGLYHGYIKRVQVGGDYYWTDGGVGRLLTKESIDPSNWVWSKVMDGLGPVTSSVVKLQNNKNGKLWLYFASGRYYYVQGTVIDDSTGQRHLVGMTEPCYQGGDVPFKTECTDVPDGNDPVRTLSDLGMVDLTGTAGSSDPDGWYITLDAYGDYTYPEGNPPADVTRSYSAERVITDPLSTTTGLVFFTSYKPYNEECGIGGKSFIWAVQYDSGGVPGAALKGMALIQVSTGSIEQIDLTSAFSEKGGRRTSAMEGVPPTAQGLSLFLTPPPVKRIIHTIER